MGHYIETPSIPEFFSGRDIFITGGTGFMGKVLIEKLLRSCPELNRMFILIRSKKNKSIHERLENLLELPLFDRLRKEQSDECFKKLIPINGDCALLGLGLSDNDIKLMNDVSIIFHSAASVRFDDNFKNAIILNTRGTRDVMLFAETLKNIKVVVHISTAFSNYDNHTVEEDMYPQKDKWQNTIKIAEHYDVDLLDHLTMKYTNNAPNTYTYSKNLSEHIANDFSDHLPVVLCRPSIVVPSLEEPMPGWVDNFNGPVGLLMACSIGILRTSHADPGTIYDMIPVDTVIKGIIVAAYKRGITEEKIRMPIYNCSASMHRKVTMEFLLKMGEALSEKYPAKQMLWKPGGCITRCKYNNFIRFLFLQLFTAYLVDIALKLTGNKPMLVKLQKKIFCANMAVKYFMCTTWNFKNDNFLQLHDSIKLIDLKTFGFKQFIPADLVDFFKTSMKGGQLYLLKQTPDMLPAAKIRYKRFSMLHNIVKYSLYFILFYWIIFTLFSVMELVGNVIN